MWKVTRPAAPISSSISCLHKCQFKLKIGQGNRTKISLFPLEGGKPQEARVPAHFQMIWQREKGIVLSVCLKEAIELRPTSLRICTSIFCNKLGCVRKNGLLCHDNEGEGLNYWGKLNLFPQFAFTEVRVSEPVLLCGSHTETGCTVNSPKSTGSFCKTEA